MANIDLDNHSVDDMLRLARRSAHVQRAHVMLVAAGLSALGVVAVAGALLISWF